MSKELDRYESNQRAINPAMIAAGLGDVLGLYDKPFGEVLKLCALHGIDLAAKCLRPAGDGE